MKSKISLIIYALLFTGTSAFAQIPTNGLIGFWPFNGNANDESGNGNNGIVTGAFLSNDRFGNSNAAYSFNGKDNFIKVLNSTTLKSPKSEITMCAWIKVNNWFFTSKGWAPIISKSTKNSGGQYRALLNNANKFEISFDEYGYSPTSSNPWKFDNWYFIAIVINNKSCKTYINCTLNSDLSFNNYMPGYNDASTDMFFGYDPLGDYEFLNGSLDDIRIYNRALSDCEIFTLCNIETNRVTVYDTIRVEVYDTVKLSVIDTLVIDANFKGDGPNNSHSTIKVYPNPTKRYLYITIDNFESLIGYSLKVIDVNGRYVYATYIDKENYSIDFDKFAKEGVFFLQIIDDKLNIIENKKILLE